MNYSTSKYLIDKSEKLMIALQRLNEVSGNGLFVCDNNVLIGTLTDGDIRRYLIEKKSLDASVELAANRKFLSLNIKERDRAFDVMKRMCIKAIPILDDEQRVVEVVTAQTVGVAKLVKQDEKLDCPVVIMAGGKGTRLYPYTKVLPKPLIPIGDVPIIEHIIEQFVGYGCGNFYLVVNHMKNMIKAYFSEIDHDYQLHFIDEDKPLGTGGGLSLIKNEISETFILTNSDILIRDNLYEAYKYHKSNGNVITMIGSLQKQQIPYGVVEIGDNGELISMKEKPELSFFTNTGCYFIEPRVIENMTENEKIDFPDVIMGYMKSGENVGVFPISSDAWLDMGQPEELEKMRGQLE